jgi:riboflavin biosynthesis pyrimidine reductase
VHRLKTGLPWVTVKWAQTLDGKIATRTGESKWISNEASRTMVHRERGRVDMLLTGIGTVLKDDPMLIARNVPRATNREARGDRSETGKSVGLEAGDDHKCCSDNCGL